MNALQESINLVDLVEKLLKVDTSYERRSEEYHVYSIVNKEVKPLAEMPLKQEYDYSFHPWITELFYFKNDQLVAARVEFDISYSKEYWNKYYPLQEVSLKDLDCDTCIEVVHKKTGAYKETRYNVFL